MTRAPADARATTVLVVEAEATQRQNVCRILREAGYRVLEAENVDRARREVSRSDTVIVGESLPESESRGLCREIKSRRETASLPVVLLTKHEATLKQPISARLDGDCDAQLGTPLRRSELLTTIATMMKVRWAGLRARILREEVEHRCAELSLVREKMAEGLVELNVRGEIVSLNASAERLLQIDLPTVVGKNFHDLVHANQELCPKDCRLRDLRFQSGTVECVLYRPSGTQILAECTLVPALEFGLDAGTLVFFRDVTDRKQAEEMLCSMEALASRGRIAAIMAHEVNNPLESVINLVYLIRKQPELSAETRQFADMAERELAHVAQITRQTLGFYRATEEPTTVEVLDLARSGAAIR